MDIPEAVLEFSGGGSFTKPAKGRVILAANQSPLGLGADPRDDLRATSIMFNSKPDGTESGDFIVEQDFRQVGLLKNPKVDSDNGTAFSESTGNGLYQLKRASTSTQFTKDNIILGGTSQKYQLLTELILIMVIYCGITKQKKQDLHHSVKVRRFPKPMVMVLVF